METTKKIINRLLELIEDYKQLLQDLDIYKSSPNNVIILENGIRHHLDYEQNLALQRFIKSQLYDCQTMLKELYGYEEPRN